ncbi:precorrin-4 C(11)-methyltransferase [uncultured Lamprocystis sp.]|jgi:precorrin-4/cobalt-precorrin-4 C11-methyltransferase|uniref:precorrin-4 C(11)-methyltransferase n=1 Tax=uncultured Lamprocystis sp. TaxID=543132 RepID=UPI0025CF67D2|nr:precorrin-4 C(11)-methyltransferase [uncultured Lamprocystis sp.]
MGRIWFVGAGPGDPDLITVKGRRLVEQAGAILYAGSLVDAAATRFAPAGCRLEDSKAMTLEEISAWLIEAAGRCDTVVRLQTGDPGLYGALTEMARPLDAAGIPWQVVPGVTSAMASAAAAGESLTLPEVTQTVILTRVAGRTPMPAGEDLESLAAHRATLCIYLSATLLPQVQRALRAAGWPAEAPILVVQKASWPDAEQIVRGRLDDIDQRCRAAGVDAQAMIIASPTLGARDWAELTPSKLYDPSFGHRFRRAAEPGLAGGTGAGLSSANECK